MREVKGRVRLGIRIQALTGVHVGALADEVTTRGVDLPVAKSPLDEAPILPSRSLRGKLRSLLERVLMLPPRAGLVVRRHECATFEEAQECQVCRVFGAAAPEGEEGFREEGRLRVSVRRAQDTCGPANTSGGQGGLELKSENVLDRRTGSAVPRTLERVTAGTCFDADLTYYIYEPDGLDVAKTDLANLLAVLRMLEEDAIGGGGTRGCGKVALRGRSVAVERLGVAPETWQETRSISLSELHGLLMEHIGMVFQGGTGQ